MSEHPGYGTPVDTPATPASPAAQAALRRASLSPAQPLLVRGDDYPSPTDLHDLVLLREMLAEILDTGAAPRRPRWRERCAPDGLVHEVITAEQRSRWTDMLASVQAEERRVRAILEFRADAQ
jgi:hypothetical protein